MEKDDAVTCTSMVNPDLILYKPTVWSIPDTLHVLILLKALSIHFKDKWLVTTVIQCSEYHNVHPAVLPRPVMPACHCPTPHAKTPLYALKQPLVWRRDLSGNIEPQLQEIR